MHKNQQISVDIIGDLRFHVGMDARKMKKHILFAALELLEAQPSTDERIAVILDLENFDQIKGLTTATRARYRTVLRDMRKAAESKI